MTLCPVASAAINNFDFRRFTVSDGLSESQVNCIYKDTRGFLWIGTPFGLNRYDGFRFKNFYTQADRDKSLPNNNVSVIIEDANHYLWLKTSLGYCIMNPLTETFDSNTKTWLMNHGIHGTLGHVATDSRHNLWFEIDNVGCYYYDFASKKSYLLPMGNGHNMLPKGIVTDISENNGATVITYNDGTLARVDGPSRRVLWLNSYIPHHGGERNKNYRTFVDRSYNYWIYTGGHAYVYLTIQRKWKEYSKLVTNIKQDREGRMWMATDHDGILIMDANGNVIKNIKNDRGDSRSIPDNTLQCLYVDEIGTIWIGTYKNGLAYHYEGQTTFGNAALGDVCTIVEDGKGDYWCGTNDNGIVRYNPACGSIKQYGSGQYNFGSDIVVCSLHASDGSLWFGTYLGGLICYHNGSFRVIRRSANGLACDNIWSLAESYDGKIYIGTLGAGLQVLNPQTMKFTTFNHANSGLKSDYISSICFDNNGNLLIGHSQYFSIMDARTYKITNFQKTRSGKKFSSPTVNQIFCDSRGLIWIATASGLNVYDRYTGQLNIINVQNKTNSSDVNSIAEDRQGMIWISSSNVVSCIRVHNKNGEWGFFVNSFSEADGLQIHQFNKRSILSTSDGNIVVGGFDGINIISPLRVISQKDNARAIFSGLVVFDHSVMVGEKFNNRVILHKSLNESHSLRLDYDENAFTIQLASSNLGIPERSHFLYRLKGFNDRWMMTAESQPNVSFTNLAPGDYQLEVKVVDYNGNAVSQVNTLDITIVPPFYRSLWAYLLYMLVLVGVVYFVPRGIILRRRESQQRKIDKMKQVFFTNVSHELRTPLSLIISPLAGIINNETDDNLRKKLKLINRNAMKLLEIINQMLDLRRLMVNSEHLQLTRGDIVQFVRGICDQFLQMTDKNITLTFHSTMSEMLMNFDCDKLGKIVNNMLSNAFKFTQNGGRVGVSLNLIDDKKHEGVKLLELKVSDNGIGISDEDKSHIFERFYQAGNHKNHGGSGIGLNLVNEYTRMHGGKASVVDNPGGGTVFIVTLPTNNALPLGDEFVEAHVYENDYSNVEEAESASMAESFGNRRALLLLVDDSDDFLEYMSSELCDEYTVDIAHNGIEALNKIEQKLPDIILTDVMMPEMDGNKLCHMVKRDTKTSYIPVVMLTARLSEENEIESRECGADDYITKPFNIEILKMHIRNLLKRCSAVNDGKLDPQITQVQITPLDEKLVTDATAYVEKNLSNTELSVVSLSEAMNMSRVNLYRKLISVTGNTPSEFIRLIRLRHAEQLLMKSQLSISEISYMVGFSSQRYFSKCYKDLFGYMPSRYKRNK